MAISPPPIAHPNLPDGWTTKHPDNVKYLQDIGAIQMTGDANLMGSYGVDLISDKIPFKPNTRYRCTGDTRSDAPNMIVFVKGYETLNAREEQVYQMRKEIAATKQWQPFNLDFDLRPTKEFSEFQQKVEYLRITLWAYWPVGTCWYRNIRFEELGPLDPKLVTNPDAVTHVGTKPRLATTQSDDSQGFDAEQTWDNAVNAFNAGQDDEARQIGQGIARPRWQQQRLSLAVAAFCAQLEKFDEADAHAQWLIDHANQPWQRDWARIVHAQALWKNGDPSSAKQLLGQVVQETQSENARQAAKDLLKQLDDSAPK